MRTKSTSILALTLLMLLPGCGQDGEGVTAPTGPAPAAVRIPFKTTQGDYDFSLAVPQGGKPASLTSEGLMFALDAATPLPEGATRKLSAQKLFAAFFADSTVCPLPGPLSKKLKNKQDKDPFIPKPVLNALKDLKGADGMEIQGDYYPGQSLGLVVHQASVKETQARLDLDGAPTMTGLDWSLIGYTGSANSVFYNVDCSGYFSASVAAKGGGVGFLVDANSAVKLSNSASMLAIRVKVANPVGMALAPDEYLPKALPTEAKNGLVITLAAATKSASENDHIEVPKVLYVAGTASQGSQSLQGEVNASASGSAGAGFVSGSGSTESRFAISNTITYGAFDSILLPAPSTDPGVKVSATIGDIRKAAKEFIKGTRVGVTLDNVGGKKVLRPRFPASVCTAVLPWTLVSIDDKELIQQGEYGGLDLKYEAGKCGITLDLTPAGTKALDAKTLYIYLKSLDFRVRVSDEAPGNEPPKEKDK